MTGLQRSALKQRIKRQAQRLGANLVGFCSVDRWPQQKEVAEAYWPQSIWPWSRTVIVLGVQIYLPMIETTPSVVYSECYNTTNRLLDDTAYRLANKLNQWGFRAHWFPRDCYGDISVLVKKPEAAFSHVFAGKYAGLGTLGLNHTLITPEYSNARGVRLVRSLPTPTYRLTPCRKKTCASSASAASSIVRPMPLRRGTTGSSPIWPKRAAPAIIRN